LKNTSLWQINFMQILLPKFSFILKRMKKLKLPDWTNYRRGSEHLRNYVRLFGLSQRPP
jgi:hypothetical protein